VDLGFTCTTLVQFCTTFVELALRLVVGLRPRNSSPTDPLTIQPPLLAGRCRFQLNFGGTLFICRTIEPSGIGSALPNRFGGKKWGQTQNINILRF